MAEVNSFSRDSKMASLDLLPIIKCGVRTAARLIPACQLSALGAGLPFQDMVRA